MEGKAPSNLGLTMGHRRRERHDSILFLKEHPAQGGIKARPQLISAHACSAGPDSSSGFNCFPVPSKCNSDIITNTGRDSPGFRNVKRALYNLCHKCFRISRDETNGASGALGV
jgi:hypothetical protein